MYSLDSKGVFTDGFADLQLRLDEKFYSSVQAFHTDLGIVLREEFAPASLSRVVEDAEVDPNRVPHSTLTAEQKETKKLVKRIIRSLQPLFDEALRREADLAGRPYQNLPDLESLLDQKLERRASALSAEGGIRQTTENGEATPDENHDHLPDGEAEAVAAKADDMQLAPTPDDNAADPHRTAHDEAADEAAIAAQLGQDALQASIEQSRNDGMDVDLAENNGQPLTPPRSEKNLLNPLGNGGIPWYLETFDIIGTTVHKERYSGRDVLRDMSEELSELDDDILDGLADSDPVRPVDAPDSNVAEIKKVAARKKQKRARNW
jgi:NuA3 HAT complex component NTO1